jgi:hypothetical protein
VLEPPADGKPLSDAPLIDEVPLVLGVMHTDSNQHVNSQYYPRAFEEASLRALAKLGRSTEVLARAVAITFRKPTFAGETLRVACRLYDTPTGLVALGSFLGPESTDPAKGRVFVQLTLRGA